MALLGWFLNQKPWHSISYPRSQNNLHYYWCCLLVLLFFLNPYCCLSSSTFSFLSCSKQRSVKFVGKCFCFYPELLLHLFSSLLFYCLPFHFYFFYNVKICKYQINLQCAIEKTNGEVCCRNQCACTLYYQLWMWCDGREVCGISPVTV